MPAQAFFETVDPCELTSSELGSALLAGSATAPLPFRAAVELVVEHGAWLKRDELLCAVRGVRWGDQVVATIDWSLIDLDDWEDQGEYQILLLARLLAGVDSAWTIEHLLEGLTDEEWELAARALTTISTDWSHWLSSAEYLP